eukprot:gene7355-8568_t
MSSMVANSKKWEDAQEKAFTNWVNSLLARVGKRVENMESDFSDGVKLIQFLEILSGKKCRRYNADPKDKINKVQNLHIGLKFLEEDLGMKARGVGAEDFYDGNKKMIFGFLWTLYRRFRIAMIRDDGSAPSAGDRDPTEREAEEQLLRWCTNMSGITVGQFKNGFRDGNAFLALASRLATTSASELEGLGSLDAASRLAAVFDYAEKNLDIPKLLDPEDVAAGTADERTIMLYTSLLFNAYEVRKRGAKTEADEVKERAMELAEMERVAIPKVMFLEEQLNMYNEELKMERLARMVIERRVQEAENRALLEGLLALRDRLEDHQLLLCRLQQQVQEQATGKLAPLWGPPQISADLSKSNREQLEQLGVQLEEEMQRINRIVHVSEVKPITIGKK